MDKKTYERIAKQKKPKKYVLKHSLYAFISGGIIGAIAQGILDILMNYFDFSQEKAVPVMSMTLVVAACILTGLGWYDKLADKAGAGMFIPITGFANSMTSSALESKSEGLVLGIGSNMFKLGGTVITFGIVSSFILGVIRYVFLH